MRRFIASAAVLLLAACAQTSPAPAPIPPGPGPVPAPAPSPSFQQSLVNGLLNYMPAISAVIARVNTAVGITPADVKMVCGGISWADRLYKIAVVFSPIPANIAAGVDDAFRVASSVCDAQQSGAGVPTAAGADAVLGSWQQLLSVLPQLGINLPMITPPVTQKAGLIVQAHAPVALYHGVASSHVKLLRRNPTHRKLRHRHYHKEIK